MASQAICTHSNGPVMHWSTSWLEPTPVHSQSGEKSSKAFPWVTVWEEPKLFHQYLWLKAAPAPEPPSKTNRTPPAPYIHI